MSTTDKDHVPYEGEDLQRYIDKMLSVPDPQATSRHWGYRLIKNLFDPVFVDSEKLPEQPCLFVANHSIYAVDGPIFGLPMQVEFDRFLRALSDKALWTEGREDFLLRQGAVLGDPDVCDALMENGKDILVFPGGAHEATKPLYEKYTLKWKDRTGFVRMAAKHGYTIVPTAVIGPEEFYSHLIEGEDLPDSRVGKLLTKLGVLDEDMRTDLLGPVPMGLFGTLFPRPHRCYVQFGDPVDLSEYTGKVPNKKTQNSIKAQVAEDIERMISALFLKRAQERPKDKLWRRLLTA